MLLRKPGSQDYVLLPEGLRARERTLLEEGSFGVYMASAGVPYAATMATANAFAMFSHYTAKNGPMDSTYTNLPNANVVNITNGFNAARNGTTCHR